ncbi:transcriptional regulator [Halobacteriales archaeon QS_8_69_26]|nr:MAG: transcriptional regulator [Halobacteriales archaeon QS_8_69_26]
MHTCRDCGRTFSSELKYELHRDTCSEDTLLCRECGNRFAERRATRDGWHYRCPNDDCDAEGLGEAVVRLKDARVATR